MGTIAGPEVGRPGNIGEVTAEWLTAVFRTSGALGAEGSVTSVSVEPFAVGLGFLSELSKATLTYSGDAAGAPRSVIIKMVTALEVQRGLADALFFYQRELRFYRELADDLPLRTAKVHAAIMDEDKTDFVIVMEDLSPLRGFDQAAGVSVADAELSIDGLAAFHATFHGRDLSTLVDTFLPFDNPIYRHALPGIFDAGWPVCKKIAADLLTPEIIEFGERFSSLVPFFMESLTGNESIVHGDWRADNLMVGLDGSLAVIDFQIVGTGRMTYDLGYFMSQSMDPEVRQPVNQQLIDRYFAALDANGVAYNRGELENVFRIATAWCLIYPVANLPTFNDLPANMQHMARTMLRRSIASIVDQNSLALLPD
ncbi:MAG: phosphotransferase [Actinomycetota bacterium]|nr:phosphotransferase [Actinomycetota bacterium]